MFRTIVIAAMLWVIPGAPWAQPAKSSCDDAQHRQFDFWVGRWTVSPTGKADVVAQSLIEKVYAGCGVRENWMPRNHQDGGSLNIYVPAEQAWRQTWIDSSGSRVDFKGGWDGEVMVLTGIWAGPLVRMTYRPHADGSVRQSGEQSTDDGKTWTPSFDFTYRRVPAGS